MAVDPLAGVELLSLGGPANRDGRIGEGKRGYSDAGQSVHECAHGLWSAALVLATYGVPRAEFQ